MMKLYFQISYWLKWLAVVMFVSLLLWLVIGCSLHVHFDKYYHGDEANRMAAAESEIADAFAND